MNMNKPLSFVDIYEANLNKDNLVDKIDAKDREMIVARVCERKDQDKKTMEEWVDTIKKGLVLMTNKYVMKKSPFENALNAQIPLLMNAVTTTASRLFTEIHRDTYLPQPRIIGRDEDNVKIDRINRVKHYINAVAIEYPYSNWIENQSKMYPKVVLMGTQIKQVKFDPHSVTFDNSFLDYEDIYIHNKSESLEKAPAITKRLYKSRNEIISNIRKELYAEYDYKNAIDLGYDNFLTGGNTNYEDGVTALYEHSFKLLEQHSWFDLDDDGYDEPYIAVVDEDNGRLLRLVPAIDTFNSEFKVKGDDVEPVELRAECYFADFHFQPDPEGNFWSMGLALMIGGLNMIVNECTSNMLNVATMATNQGGLVGSGAKNMSGKVRVDTTKFNYVPGVTGDNIRNAMVPFDIRDPSPVLKELTIMLIEMGEKIGTLSEALSGEMPAREMPAQTMLMMIEQSLKNAQAVYRRMHMGLSKELQIMLRILVQNGDQEHYQQTLDDPEANLTVDCDVTSMDLSYTTDSSSGSAAERIVKFNVIREFIQDDAFSPYVNVKEVLTRLFKVLDIADSDKLLQDPPPPAPDPTIELGNRQLTIDEKDKQDRNEIDAYKAVATVEKARADSAKALVESNLPAEALLHTQVQQQAPMLAMPVAPPANPMEQQAPAMPEQIQIQDEGQA